MKLVNLTLASLILVTSVLAQTNTEETVTVKKSDLTAAQLDKIKAEETQHKIEQYGKWVGMGHEVGTAVNESLSAITTNAQNFSGTTPGKVALFLVIYKVIGHDLLGILVSVIILVVGLPVWIWSYRRYLPHKYLVSETIGEDKKITRRYDYGYGGLDQSRLHDEAASIWCVVHWGLLIGYTIVCLVAIFS